MKLYGTPASRAMRSIWAAEEVGVDYELIPTSFLEESKTSEYLAINPNGRIPALVDGDLVLFESMAINLYLAKTYGGKLYPGNPHDEARALQWTIEAVESCGRRSTLGTLPGLSWSDGLGRADSPA